VKKHSPVKEREREREREKKKKGREREKGGDIHAIAKLSIHAFHSEM